MQQYQESRAKYIQCKKKKTVKINIAHMAIFKNKQMSHFKKNVISFL